MLYLLSTKMTALQKDWIDHCKNFHVLLLLLYWISDIQMKTKCLRWVKLKHMYMTNESKSSRQCSTGWIVTVQSAGLKSSHSGCKA